MKPLIDGDIEYRNGGLYWLKSRNGVTVGRRVGSINSVGYRHFTYKGKIYLEHRVIYEYINNTTIPKGMHIDHIDRNKLNNNPDNLRLVTPQENQQNRECKGYSWDKQKRKWKSRIVHNKKHIHIGHFLTEDEAHQAYLMKKKEIHSLSRKEDRDEAIN